MYQYQFGGRGLSTMNKAGIENDQNYLSYLKVCSMLSCRRFHFSTKLSSLTLVAIFMTLVGCDFLFCVSVSRRSISAVWKNF